MTQKVIVIGRNYNSRLGMIRAAGLRGCEVAVIRTSSFACGKDGDFRDIDGYSRYAGEYLLAKEPDRKALIAAIKSVRPGKEGKTILLPTDDYSASTIDMFADELKDSYLFPNIDMTSGKVTEMMDKDEQKIRAMRAGLSVAQGWVVDIKDGVYTIPEGIIYPCFPKPQISFLGSKTCMKKCSNEAELREVVEMVAAKADCPLLIEQYMDIGKEYATLGFSDGERVILPAMIQLLHDGKGPHKGVTLQGRVVPPDAFGEFFAKVEEFIRNMHFTGLFDVDSYESGGQMYFNELNLRFGASGYSITSMGVNLPEMLIRTLRHEDIGSCPAKIGSEAVFVNEKVAADDYVGGFISKSQYDGFVSASDIRFISNPDDPEPGKIFQRQFRHQLAKMPIKRILKWLKLR